jgi:hypothetical protein
MACMFTCLHCGKVVPRNPRLKKKQKYCPEKACQQARVRNWKKQQYKKSSSYRKKCKEAQKLWREHYPCDQYQRAYREKHPEYVKRNRQLQKHRNHRRLREPALMNIMAPGLLLQPREDGSYLLARVKKKLIVNRNALSIQPSIDGVYAILKIKDRKIVNRNALLSSGLVS